MPSRVAAASALIVSARGNIVPRDAILQVGDPLQRRVPPGLEFAGDQPLGRVDHLVAAGSHGGIVTRFLKLPAKRLPDLVAGLQGLIGGLDRSFNGVFGDGLDDLCGDGAIDPDAADANTKPAADVTVVAAAMVAMSMARLRAIEHSHRPTTATATHQAS